MKINEHEMRGLLTGKCLPGDMRLNEDLPSYLVRKFDELQQKLGTMEAGLELKGWVACSPEWIDKNGPCSCEAAPRIAFGNIGQHYHPQSFTPATDAYLKSVRAEGADEVAIALGKIPKREMNISGQRHYYIQRSEAILTAEDVAEQLRSGTHDTADKAG